MQKDWSTVDNILAIRLDNLGDVLMCEPSLRALKRSLPQARLTLLASPGGARATPMIAAVDEVIVRSVSWQDAQGKMPLDPKRERQLIEEVRQENFDAAVIFTSFSQSPYPPAYMCYLAGVPIRIGQSKEFGGSLLTTWVKSGPDTMHQLDRNARLLETSGFYQGDRGIKLTIPEQASASIAQKLAARGVSAAEPYITINTSASCPSRTYPWSRLAQVAMALTSIAPVVITGESRDAGFMDLLPSTTNAYPLISLVAATSVIELAALIERSALLVTNLTATMHMASATGTPAVVLFAGTELESQWEPRGCPATLLRRKTSCSPCYLFECPYDLDCLDISPEEVVASSHELLRQTTTAGRQRTVYEKRA